MINRVAGSSVRGKLISAIVLPRLQDGAGGNGLTAAGIAPWVGPVARPAELKNPDPPVANERRRRTEVKRSLLGCLQRPVAQTLRVPLAAFGQVDDGPGDRLAGEDDSPQLRRA